MRFFTAVVVRVFQVFQEKLIRTLVRRGDLLSNVGLHHRCFLVNFWNFFKQNVIGSMLMDLSETLDSIHQD